MTTKDPRSFSHTKKDDARPLEVLESSGNQLEPKEQNSSTWNTAWINLRHFFHPYVLLLCLGACVRHTGLVEKTFEVLFSLLRLTMVYLNDSWIFLGLQQSTLF